MKISKTMLLFLTGACLFISSAAFAQCSACTSTNPATLPATITASDFICITTSTSYAGSFVLDGGQITVCGNSTLSISGAFVVNSGSIILNGCGAQLKMFGSFSDPGVINVSGYCGTGCTNNFIYNSSNATTSSVSCSSSPLPIELSAFTASCSNTGVTVKWTTLSEENSDHFTIYKSGNAIDWTVLTAVQAGGNSHIKKEYGVWDEKGSAGISYYKLRQVDLNKHYEDSKIIDVACIANDQNTLRVYPNPLSYVNSVYISCGAGRLEITDFLGKVVKRLEHDGGDTEIDATDLDQGIYTISLISSNGTLRRKFIRN